MGVIGFEYAILCLIIHNFDGTLISVTDMRRVHYIEPPVYNTGLFPQAIIHRKNPIPRAFRA